MPKDAVNILLVTARPFDHDVSYRSISRPLLDLVEKQKLPVSVTLLRPPTLERLREHLGSERSGYYHILHFDGHGSYRVHNKSDDNVDSHRFSGPEGYLVFEDADGQPDPVTAETLSTLLREHRIPAVVLNACQSAMMDDRAADPFASVAASLLKAGIRSVVAMGWSLYVSAAQEFLPAFYRRLFESGQFPEAVRAGRQQLLAQKKRVCARGRYELEDWVVPVLYQQDVFELDFLNQPIPNSGVAGVKERGTSDEPPDLSTSQAALPEDAVDTHNPYGFIGRDAAVLALERAMHRPPAGLLIHGLGGVGKTTLARGFIHWLLQTDGVQAEHVFWFRFADDVRTAEYVFNRLGERFFGDKFLTLETARKREALTAALREHPLLIVWDNFEVVRGIDFGEGSAAGGSVHAAMDAAQQDELKQFLAGLRGGKTRVLITSRSDEAWLGATNRFHIPLGGLKGEELWDYCTAILRDFNFKVDRNEPELTRLLELLDGHPLTMRAVLPELERRSLTSIIESLEKNLAGLSKNDADIGSESRLYATLGFLNESVPDELQELRIPLSLHERFVDGDYLHAMAKQVDEAAWSREKIDRFQSALCTAGLLRDIGQSIYEMHPLLSRYLRALNLSDRDDRWHRAFVEIKGSLASHLTPKPLHEQRAPFHWHGANFETARQQAERLDQGTYLGAVTQALAAHALNTRRFDRAIDLFDEYAEFELRQDREDRAAAPYHQLGRIAEEQRDLESAEKWYKKSLEINERLGNEHGAASTYHQLGRIAQEQRDLESAEKWYKKSLEIEERLGNEHGAAITYHQLGRIAQEQRDLESAEKWYKKSLAIFEKFNDGHSKAIVERSLTRLAELKQQDLEGDDSDE